METNPLKTCIDRLLKVLPTDADSLNAGLSLCETRSDLLHWVEIGLAEHPELHRRCVPILQQLGFLGGNDLSVEREFDISTSLLNISMSQPEHVLQHKEARKIR